MLQREQARGDRRAAQLAREIPATYLLFDLLYVDGEPILDLPLVERRDRLRTLLEAHPDPRLILSDGVIGPGLSYFEQAQAARLEGVVAKKLSSRYVPGQRADTWIKIKKRHRLPCAIIGYLPDGERDLRSLVLAAEVDGVLVPVGRVGSGFTHALRRALAERFGEHRRSTPIVEVRHPDAIWLEPGFYCTVSFLEWTSAGQLRSPVFEGMIE
ncbi:MAG: hypothetical protein KDC38_03525 [Planctomycetes bacterium]|nr:hypothetical protein [Planctomycetota bacterium]